MASLGGFPPASPLKLLNPDNLKHNLDSLTTQSTLFETYSRLCVRLCVYNLYLCEILGRASRKDLFELPPQGEAELETRSHSNEVISSYSKV
jgi:hypothetical protein